MLKNSCLNSIDGDSRIALESAKIKGNVDFSYTCFKGKTRFTKEDLANSMWLSKRKLQESFM